MILVSPMLSRRNIRGWHLFREMRFSKRLAVSSYRISPGNRILGLFVGLDLSTL
jgi:hypothetical protein